MMIEPFRISHIIWQYIIPIVSLNPIKTRHVNNKIKSHLTLNLAIYNSYSVTYPKS